MIPGEFLLYETEDGKTLVECWFVEDTLWLTQILMANWSWGQLPEIPNSSPSGLTRSSGDKSY